MMAPGLILALLLWDRGSISLGSAYLIFNYCNLVSSPLQDFRNHMGDMQSARAGILRCGEFLDLPPGTGAGKQSLPNGALTLTVKDLRFSYGNNTGENNTEVLKGVNITIPAGGKTGVMGETGCGKSTLLSLIAALNPYGQGSIRLNGIELKEIASASLRDRIAYCTQQVQIIHGTIRENITLFDEQFSDRDILEAIEALRLTDWFKKFPEGLDTRLEMGEDNLSSGEAQLLALVRLALKRPGLVLLDEISSSLDAVTERRITGAVKALCEGRTVLAIAHRREALDWMDAVMRMENGVLLTPEAGTGRPGGEYVHE